MNRVHPLILASASPRRADLLRLLGVDFTVRHAEIDENRRIGEAPEEFAQRLAREKAAAVAAGAGRAAVLGGDTLVALGGEVLGKPADAAEAAAMLARLSGRTHRVLSAVALAVQGECRVLLSVSEVTFDLLEAGEIDAYCATGEPLDKAGAYGIQGRGGAFVRRVAGSCSGIVGLPLWETRRLLRERGIIGPDD